MNHRLWMLIALLCCAVTAPISHADDAPAAAPSPTYSQVHALFVRHCLACHNATDAQGGLILENHAALMKGGEHGAVIVPGKAGDSLLIKLIEHAQKPVMPPVKKGEKLSDDDIAILRAWVNKGAPPPKPGEVLVSAAPRPKIEPKVAPRRAISALAYSPQLKLLAIARHGEVELLSAEDRSTIRVLQGHRGNVNDLALSADGTTLAAAAGLPGEFGEVRLWNLADGKLIRTFEGHRDSIYSVSISPDGLLLATGSYDQKIILWNNIGTTGTPLRTLAGHNGAIFDLAFRPDGKVLASVSADRTLKLWNVATGDRLDTRSESMQALHAVVFNPKGDRVYAAGVDNRIRAWRITADAKEGSNPLLTSRFAHEGAILQLRFSADGTALFSSADDRTVKSWNSDDLASLLVLEKQLDWPTAISPALDGRALAVGRLDGGIAFYDAKTGSLVPPPKPEVALVAIPFGLERGQPRDIRITGKCLTLADEVRTSDPKITGSILRENMSATAITLRITAASDARMSTQEFWIANAGGESAKLKLLIDDLPQVTEQEPNDTPSNAKTLALPASAWGTLSQRGDTDHFAFTGKANQLIVVDAMSARLGTKANLIVSLSDAKGQILASNNDFAGSPDSFLAVKLPGDGRYTINVRDLEMAGSVNHVYRLSVGELPMATSVFPLSVAENVEASVQLIGFHLPQKSSIKLPASPGGELAVPIDGDRLRTRRELKVLATTGMPDTIEREPNDAASEATPLALPGVVNGRIDRPASINPSDRDLYRITAKKGQQIILETMAARLGSPVDTKIEVLHGEGPRTGQPVTQLQLRAVRDTAHTFRPIDANAIGTRLVNWEEMQQNELLYMQGEVVKLFLPPRGPDSQWDFYTLGGKRRCYFDTSATAHALDEPCYIVEPLAPDAPIPPANGLPIFTVPFANDDDQERALGSDSRVNFNVPADGAYLIRITDSRGFGGEDFAYRLIAREARPDYRAVLLGANPTVPAGSGIPFTVTANRIDGFDGPITIDIAGLPPGFTVSSPLVIEAGHTEAKGVLFAAADAPAPTAENQAKTVVASRALIDGKEVMREINSLGTIKLGAKPKLLVTMIPEPMPAAAPAGNQPFEITITPGQTTTARLKLDRNGHADLASFDIENLPHGIIVADLGLNGLLIRADENERVIFISCAAWVSEMDRLCYARAKEAGSPASKPVLLKVRKTSENVAKNALTK